MKSKVLFGLASVAMMLAACDMQGGAQSEAKITPNSTDDQKFAYMLGAQFGLHNFKMIPLQMGEELDEDAVVQGIRDAYKSEKDTNFRLQVEPDTLRDIGFDYNSNARARMASIWIRL